MIAAAITILRGRPFDVDGRPAPLIACEPGKWRELVAREFGAGRDETQKIVEPESQFEMADAAVGAADRDARLTGAFGDGKPCVAPCGQNVSVLIRLVLH